MHENGRERDEQIGPEVTAPCQEQNQNGRELVEAMFRAEFEREVIEQGHVKPLPPHESPTIHYTELPLSQPGSQLYKEWNFYRREAGRLLAEGHEGRFVLINGEDLIGIWSTQEEAEAVALQKYLMQPCLIHQVRNREPVVRLSPRFLLCRS